MNIVITTNIKSPRYLHTIALLHSLNLTTHVIMTSYKTTPLRRRSELISGHIRAMDCIISSEEGWGRVFEDDIQLHDKISSRPDLTNLFTTYRRSIFYGLCEPRLKTLDKYVGLCTHAYALSANHAHNYRQQLVNDQNHTGPDRSLLKVVEKLGGLPLIGRELVSPDDSHHVGMFYQWRSRYRGTIGIGPG